MTTQQMIQRLLEDHSYSAILGMLSEKAASDAMGADAKRHDVLADISAALTSAQNAVAMIEGGEAHFEVENLDCMSVDELQDYMQRMEQRRLRVAETDQELAETLAALTTYAGLKARAMPLRLAGQINEALRLEREADSIYETIREWARW